MADHQVSRDGRPRYLIATGVTRDLPRSRDTLIASVDLMAALFTGVFGYQRVTALGIDPTAEQLRAHLRDFCESCGPEDIVAYYHTGHADIGQRGHRFRTGGEGNYYVTSVPTDELAELMLDGTALRRALIILDTCFAGQGGAEALLAGLRAADRAPDKTLTVVTAAHPAEQVRAGDFARLFEQAVKHPATAGHEPAYLPLSAIVGHIRDNPRRPRWQTVSESVLFNSEDIQPFLPNPRFDRRLHGLDLFTQLRIQQRQLRAEDIRSHFLPRAQGTDIAGEVAWRFVGRQAALRDLTSWLSESGGSRICVVTGDPGSGKSAVIGRLVILADPQRRASVPLDGILADTIPDARAIDVAVHARGLTTGQVLDGLAAAAGIQAETPGQFLTALRGKRLVAAVDAIDESVDPHDLVDRLLRPFADAGHSGLRLLLGTRRHLIEGLGPIAEVLDLDADNYTDPSSLTAYAARCLRDSRTGSPYLTAEPELVSAVAEAVAEAAGRSFLVALIAARTLALQGLIPDPGDPAWRARLPSTAAEAMHQDLQSRLGPDADRARDLLRPLAYAAGAGLPWEDIWAPVASAISQRHYSDDDIIWLRTQAGYYIVEAQQAGGSVYRLYHAALADYLRQDHDEGKVSTAIVDFLTEHTKTVSGATQPDWSRAHPYTRGHLATHAARARRLDPLILDPGFLLSAIPAGVLAALPAAQSPDGHGASAAYQRTVHHLEHGTPGHHLAYLELSSHRTGAHALQERLVRYPGNWPWRTFWTRWPTEHPHRVLTANDGRPILHLDSIVNPGRSPWMLAISDLGWHIWNPVTGEQLLTHHTGSVHLADARTIAGGSGGIRLVTVDYRWEMRIYDLAHATTLHQVPIGERWMRILNRVQGKSGPFRYAGPLIACAHLPDGTPVAVTIRYPGIRNRARNPVVAIWDVDTGMLRAQASLNPERKGYPRLPELTCIQLPEGPPVAILSYRHIREDQNNDYAVDLASGDQLKVKIISEGPRKERTARLSAPNGHEWELRNFDTETELAHRPNDPGVTDSLPILRPDGDNVRVIAKEAVPKQLTLTGHTLPVTRAIWLRSPVGEPTVVSGSQDSTIRIWAGPFENITETPQSSVPPINDFDILQLPDAQILGATAENQGDPDESCIRLWDFTTGTHLTAIPLPCPVSAITCMWAAPRTPAVVAYGTDHFLRAWELHNGKPIFERLADPYSFGTQISGILLPDGQSLVVSVGHNNSAAALWNAQTGEFRRWLYRHIGFVSCSACGTYKGRTIALTVGYDRGVCIWELPRGKLIRTFGSRRSRWHPMSLLHEMESVQLAELSESRLVAITRDRAGIVRIWDARHWRHLAMLKDIRASTLHSCGVQVSGDRLLILNADDDASVRLWLVTGGNRKPCNSLLLDRIDLESRILGMRVTPDHTIILNTSHGMAAIRLQTEVLLSGKSTPAR
jgi:WD40 repeat protein